MNDYVGCRSKVLGASSVGLPIAECNMTVTRQLQPFIVVCITRISDRFCIVSAFQADLFFAIYL
jgi:hypothetical protein